MRHHHHIATAHHLLTQRTSIDTTIPKGQKNADQNINLLRLLDHTVEENYACDAQTHNQQLHRFTLELGFRQVLLDGLGTHDSFRHS